MTQHAQASGAVYRLMKYKPVVGDLRVKSWRFLIPPSGEDDPVWAQRCREYWELQQETFGLKFSDFTMMIDYDEMIVTTAATILAILPGERRMSYTAPRKQAGQKFQ